MGAKRRYTDAENPLAGKEHLLQTEKNVLTNTVEQLHIFLLLVVTLTTYLEPSEMRIIPLYSLAFITGRVLFMIGYSISPRYRSVGMGTNFILSFFFIGYAIYLMYLHGFMYGTLTANPTATTGTRKSELWVLDLCFNNYCLYQILIIVHQEFLRGPIFVVFADNTCDIQVYIPVSIIAQLCSNIDISN